MRSLSTLVSMLPELYRQEGVPDFLEFGRHLVERCIPGDYHASLEWRLDGRQPRIAQLADGDGRTIPYVRRLPDGLPDHPFLEQLARTGCAALRLSDCRRTSVERHRSHHRDIYEALELNYQVVAFAFADPKRLVCVTVSRARRNFTAAEVAMLELLTPHFRQALHVAEATAHRLHDRREVQPYEAERFHLTRREAEIGLWVTCGKTNQEIAAIVGVRPRTVEKHVENIFRKLGVENRTAAAQVLQHVNRAV